MHAISSYRGNRPTKPQTHNARSPAPLQTDKTDNNTLVRSVINATVNVFSWYAKPLSGEYKALFAAPDPIRLSCEYSENVQNLHGD